MAIDYLGAVKRSYRVMTDKPLAFLGIFALSAAAFFSEHVAVYVLSQAFTSTHVIINIEFPVFLMAIVAGNIARLIPVTPGGLGQFEWAFAMAIYLSGTGMPEAGNDGGFVCSSSISRRSVIWCAHRLPTNCNPAVFRSSLQSVRQVPVDR